MVKNLRSRGFWLLAFLVVGVIGAIASFVPKVSTREVGSVRSPDGSTEAVLIAIDASGVHNYRVCFKRPNATSLNSSSCRDIAYLGGVSSVGSSQPVTLIWTSPSQLEVRYASASSVHVYTPVFVWGSTRPGSAMGRSGYGLLIFTRLVPTKTETD